MTCNMRIWFTCLFWLSHQSYIIFPRVLFQNKTRSVKVLNIWWCIMIFFIVGNLGFLNIISFFCMSNFYLNKGLSKQKHKWLKRRLHVISQTLITLSRNDVIWRHMRNRALLFIMHLSATEECQKGFDDSVTDFKRESFPLFPVCALLSFVCCRKWLYIHVFFIKGTLLKKNLGLKKALKIRNS